MKEKIKRFILKQSIIYGILLFFIVFPFKSANALNLKIFVIEKVGSDKILISDGSSEYLIEHDYNCSDWDFNEGSTIYINTYYSPMYGDEIIIPGFTDKVCEVTDSDDVNIKEYYVEDVFDSEDKIIVSDSNGNKYLVEYGFGCGLSMWRYEGKKVDIDMGGVFLNGIGDTIYLLNDGRDCRVWDVEELSGGNSGGYTPPNNPDTTCPINSSLTATGCACNSGYVTDSTKTYCVAQKPSCPANSSYINGACTCNEGYTTTSTGGCITYTLNCAAKYGFAHGDKSGCYCDTGYEMDKTKNLCIKVFTCPINSEKSNNQCFCNNGYLWNGEACITHTQNCINSFGYHIHGSKGDNNNSFCNCDDGYQWNSSQTACVYIETITKAEEKSTPVQKESLQQSPTIQEQQKQQNKTELENVVKATPKPEQIQKRGLKENISQSFTNVFSTIKNAFSKIFSWFRR